MFQGSSLWAGLASGVLSQIQHTRDLTQGNMDRTKYAVHTAGNVTGAVGVMAGVEYGALLGTSVLPGVGTAIGAVVGAVVGDKVGRAIGHRTGEAVFQSQAGRKATEVLSSSQPIQAAADAVMPNPIPAP